MEHQHAILVQENDNDLRSGMDDLHKAYKSLEAENESLLEQLKLRSGTDEEKAIVINTWREENETLRKKIGEQQYLQDMLDEKIAEIGFLQSQAEQRIKNHHSAEQQREAQAASFNRLKEQYQVSIDEMEVEKKERISLAQQLESDRSILSQKQDEVIYLGNVVSELRSQNELLAAAVTGVQEKAGIFEQQAADAIAKRDALEQKLLVNKQLLHRLYRELGATLDVEPASQLTTLHMTYVTEEQEL